MNRSISMARKWSRLFRTTSFTALGLACIPLSALLADTAFEQLAKAEFPVEMLRPFQLAVLSLVLLELGLLLPDADRKRKRPSKGPVQRALTRVVRLSGIALITEALLALFQSAQVAITVTLPSQFVISIHSCMGASCIKEVPLDAQDWPRLAQIVWAAWLLRADRRKNRYSFALLLSAG